MPVRIVPSQGKSSDQAVTPMLIEAIKPERALVADRGYNAQALVELVKNRGGRAHIPTCRDRKLQRAVDARLYRQRNLIERFFKKLKHFRGIATRYDKTARNFLAASCSQPRASGCGLSPRPNAAYTARGSMP